MIQGCRVPSVSLNISPQGDLTLCCIAGLHTIGHISKVNSLEDFFNSSVMDYYRDELAKGNIETLNPCNKCYKWNKEGFTTFRNRIEDYFTFPRDELDKKARAVGMNVPIRHLEYTLSNICNQSCAMCSSWFSHTWKEIDKKFGRKVYPLAKLNEESIEKIEKVLYGLDYIEIKGGEPFADIRNLRILKKLIEVNPKCNIQIVTNMQSITPEAMSILKQLPNIKLFASIDGVGKVYDWIRGGNFEKTVSNMENFYNETGNTIQIGTTITLYNFYSLEKIQEYFENKPYIHNIAYDNWARGPLYSTALCLPEDMFNKRLEELKQKINIVSIKWETRSKYHTLYDLKQLFLEETEKMNEHRGFNLFDHVPELKEWYK